jgi:23S rRNA pseudouridine1911/1915/1917 synthase
LSLSAVSSWLGSSNNLFSLKRIESEIVSRHRGERLDIFLARELGQSRARVQALLLQNLVHKEPVALRLPANYRLRTGDSFTVEELPEREPSHHLPENIPLEIIHEDKSLLVLNKPPGLVVHPAAGHATGTLVNALLHHCGDRLAGRGGDERLGIVHRLDKDTSGLMVIARTDAVHDALGKQFADREITKIYLALVRGKFRTPRGDCRGSIGRHPVNRKKMSVLNRGGREAHTAYKVIKEWPPASSTETMGNARRKPAGEAARVTLVECTLHTGRTHQIRVHLAQLGHPVIGDALYGRASKPGEPMAPRQLLHATRLGFTHPVTGKKMEFNAPLPEDFQNYIQQLEQRD